MVALCRHRSCWTWALMLSSAVALRMLQKELRRSQVCCRDLFHPHIAVVLLMDASSSNAGCFCFHSL